MTITDSVKDSLTKSEVIPTVIHDKTFSSKGFLTIKYDSGKEVALGNSIKPSEAQSRPRIDFMLNLPSGNAASFKIAPSDKFTLVVTDPDAPTRGDEKWSEYCHYLATDVTLNPFDPDNAGKAEGQLSTVDLKGQDTMPYVGPGPPPGTGKHRYVFLLYKQTKGTPPPPSGRPNWGTGVKGSGAAEYAQKYGLELYAVNYFYSQNEGQ